MAKFNRFNGNVLPFGSGSSVGERWTFGSGGSLVSNNIDDNLNADYLAGWEAGLNSEGYPTSQDFNAQQYTNSLLVSYLFQSGIPEWNSSQEYYTNSYCVGSDGRLYRAKTGTSETPNTGNNPTTDSTNWEDIEGKFVDQAKTYDLGVNQSWSNVSKLPNITYTNTSGKPIAIAVTIDSSITNGVLSIHINGVFHQNITLTAQSNDGSIFTVIPDGASYHVATINATVITWQELF